MRKLERWPKEKLLLLIQRYWENPILWDPEHPENDCREEKKPFLVCIGKSLSCDASMVRRKWKSLRSRYESEKRKIAGTEEESKWFAFKSMAFLDNVLVTQQKSNNEDRCICCLTEKNADDLLEATDTDLKSHGVLLSEAFSILTNISITEGKFCLECKKTIDEFLKFRKKAIANYEQIKANPERKTNSIKLELENNSEHRLNEEEKVCSLEKADSNKKSNMNVDLKSNKIEQESNNFESNSETEDEDMSSEKPETSQDLDPSQVESENSGETSLKYPLKFTCSYCGRRFKFKSLLLKHLASHENLRLFQCHICGVSFNERHPLKMHVRRHNGIKPFECNICHRKFPDQSYLTQHMKIHSNEKVNCPDCGKGFSRYSSMATHRRRHTGDLPHACNQCEKRYASKSSLRMHINSIHLQIKYPCSLCTSVLSTKSHLNFHVKQHIKKGDIVDIPQ